MDMVYILQVLVIVLIAGGRWWLPIQTSQYFVVNVYGTKRIFGVLCQQTTLQSIFIYQISKTKCPHERLWCSVF